MRLRNPIMMQVLFCVDGGVFVLMALYSQLFEFQDTHSDLGTITILSYEVFSYSSHFYYQKMTRRNSREGLGYRLRVHLIDVGREEGMADRVLGVGG